MLLTNPKNGDTLETNLSLEQATEIVAKLADSNSFALDLVQLVKNNVPLSAGRRFWFFKLAEDAKELEPIQLASDLEAFIKPFGMLQFKVGKISEYKEIGKIKFLSTTYGADVWSGKRVCGVINKDKFNPKSGCPKIIMAQVKLFAESPVQVLEYFGKATGYCCVCGRLLTNEESVYNGIGPICRGRYSL